MLVVRAGKNDQQWKRFCTLVFAGLLGTYFCLNYQFASSSAVAWPVIGIRLVFNVSWKIGLDLDVTEPVAV
jgi:hypothetical protein